MKDTATPKADLKKDWTLTQSALARLLNWFDQDADSGGERYEEMRRRLVAYFDRKNCLSPDDLADETLNRVARRLEEEGGIVSDAPAHYCYIVARFVLLEALRVQQRQEPLDDRLSAQSSIGGPSTLLTSWEREERELRWDCLEQCMQLIGADNRELIIGYYHGEQREKINNRRAMAAKLGVSQNALSIRACRIRDKLEACTQKCIAGL